MTNNKLNINIYNDDFLIIKSEKTHELAALGLSIFEHQFDFVSEVIVTNSEICLKLNANFQNHHLSVLHNLDYQETKTKKIHNLPVYFNDHEDWKAVAAFSEFTKEIIIERIVSTDFNVAMFGFLPGFMYLTGLEAKLHVPRKKIPSKYVEARSIAIGGKYLGLYSIDSPGGWHVIGSTPVSVLNLSELPPVSMNLEDSVRIVKINEEEYKDLLTKEITLEAYNTK